MSQTKQKISLPAKGVEPSRELLQELNDMFNSAHPDEILEWAYGQLGTDMVLGTGFGASGVYLIHRLVERQLPVPIFFLDTRLLFNETYELKEELEKRFKIDITAVSTNLTLQQQANTYGDELWKKDPNQCCYLRKVLPLKSYLSDKAAWVTGIRRGQSKTRRFTQIFEWDPGNRVIKINPVAAWTGDQLWDYIHEYDLPYNPLHDHGYPSIGCIPCTSPVDDTQDERAGRWKDSDKIECGIHVQSQEFQNGNGQSSDIGQLNGTSNASDI